MAIHYISIEDAIRRQGLRLVLVQGAPSPWGQAAKAMMEYKGLEFVCAPQEPGGANEALLAWSGVSSGPVVAWNDESPVNRWDDILFLLERLAPDKPLVPEDRELRVRVLGFAQEFCGELGLGWNARLCIFRPAMESGQAPESVTNMAAKYGYRERDVALAEQRLKATVKLLNDTIAAQRARGSDYLVGDGLTAADFFCAAFYILLEVPGPDIVPLAEETRQMLNLLPSSVRETIEPKTRDYCLRILQKHFKLPMEM